MFQGTLMASLALVSVKGAPHSESDHFYLHTETKTWQDAQAFCQSEYGTSLASIQNADQNAEIQALFAALNPTALFWIGLNSLNSAQYVWESGDTSDYRKWKAGHEGLSNSPGNPCIHYGTEFSSWWDGLCTHQFPFACDRPWPESTHFILVQVPGKQAEGEDFCQARYGTHLATVNSQALNDELEALRVANGNYFHIYIGLNDKDEEGVWVWEDGTPDTWNNWQPGEPNNSGTGEDCTDARPNAWNDDNCHGNWIFACNKKDPSNECYIRVDQSANAWTAAQYCQDHYGTTLASICNADAQEKFADLMSEYPGRFMGWIGLKDEQNGGGLFSWDDGSAYGYSNWAWQSPGNYWGVQHCVLTDTSRDNQWDDVACGLLWHGFTCNAPNSPCACHVPDPILQWTFDDEYESQNGFNENLRLKMEGTAKLDGNFEDHSFLQLNDQSWAWTHSVLSDGWSGDLTEKSYSVWVSLNDLEAQAWPFSLDSDYDAGNNLAYGHKAFDAIAFREHSYRKWELGTEYNAREVPFNGPEEDVQGDWINLVMSFYPDGRVALYRNGEQYGNIIQKAGNPHPFPSAKTRALFGWRHNQCNHVDCRTDGELDLVEIYDHALSAETANAIYRRGRKIYKYGWPSNDCFILTDNHMPRWGSQHFCQQTYGTDLATIANQDAQTSFELLARSAKTGFANRGKWYIGLKDVVNDPFNGNNDVWEWEDGSSSEQFTKWGPGQPLQEGRDFTTATIFVFNENQNPSMYWTNVPPHYHMYTACNAPNSACPSIYGYDRKGYHGNGKYVYVTGQSVNADGANAFCQANWNTNLAKIESSSDQARLATLLNEAGANTGINLVGLSDPNNDGIYTWRDGTAGPYTNYASQEPGQCVVTNGDNAHRWEYAACASTFNAFTCNAPAPGAEQIIDSNFNPMADKQDYDEYDPECPSVCSKEICSQNGNLVCSATPKMFVDASFSGDECNRVFCRDCSSDLTSCVQACTARRDWFGDDLACESMCIEAGISSEYRCFNNYS